MSYEKLSPEKFAENLKSGRYANLTGARRAIGKAEWADSVKDQVRAKAEKHFGGAATPAPVAKKAAAKEPTRPTPKAKAVAAEPKKRGRPAGVKTVAKAAPAKHEAKAASGVTFSDEQFEKLLAKFIPRNPVTVAEELQNAIAGVNQAINTVTAAVNVCPTLNVEELQTSVDITMELSRRLGKYFDIEVSRTEAAEAEAPIFTEKATNGQSGEAYYASQSS